MKSKQLKKMLASYGRSIIAAASALYLAGVTDPVDLAWSLAAALIPVVLRAVNPNDPAFGVLPSKKTVEKAAKSATPKKAPIKRAPPTKKK